MILKEKAEQLEKEIKELEKGCERFEEAEFHPERRESYLILQATLTEKQKHLATIKSFIEGIERLRNPKPSMETQEKFDKFQMALCQESIEYKDLKSRRVLVFGYNKALEELKNMEIK